MSDLTPAPANPPNRATNPATGLPFEGRTEVHQSEDRFPPQAFFQTRMGANPNAKVHPDLPAQTLWGFNQGGADLAADPPISPGPVLVMRYGTPTIVRRHNALPPPGQNGGFGVPEVSTHLHNFHSAPDSDGGPCDPVQQRFFSRGQYYDYFYNMQFAGWNSTNPPAGNIQEALGFLWYHDHRVDHTAENTYKGLVGPAIVFNDFDTGDESTGFHLPGFPDFDIPLVFADRLFDPRTGLLAFDTFNTDGILGNVFLVNGKVQPFFEVSKRRYRFRLLVAGPSRFFEFFLTNPDNLSQRIPFWVISERRQPAAPAGRRSRASASAWRSARTSSSTSPRSPSASAIRRGSASRTASSRPTAAARRATSSRRGADQLLEFRLTGGAVTDGSFDPEPVAFPNVPARRATRCSRPISLPDISAVQPRVTRTFQFERGDGGWQINGTVHGLHPGAVPAAGQQRRALDHRQRLGRLAAPGPHPPRGVPHPQPQRRAR